MRKVLLFSSVCATLLTTGCTMAPAYSRPRSPAPQNWPSPSTATGAVVMDQASWRSVYTDPGLIHIIEVALENNRDLRIAALNVEKLRAQYRIARADLLPAVDATGSLTKTRTPGDLSGSGKPVSSKKYGASVGITSWELDLFGRVNSLRKEALETYLAGIETRRSVQVTLVAEVATQYLTRVSLAEELAVAKDNLDSANKTLELTLAKKSAGAVGDLEVETARATVAQASASLAARERDLAEADTELSFLVGRTLSEAELGSVGALDTIAPMTAIAPGLPSELLERRPDILAAEHTLRAANADIGAARAAFFPKITLTASDGTASAQLSGLFKSGSNAWTFAPQVSLPIFAAGANKSALDVSRLEKKVEIATYEKAIQTAFKEAADALAAGSTIEREYAANVALAEAQRKRLALAEERFSTGFASYLDVTTAQAAYYSARMNLIETRLARINNQVTLFKVLGGGWK